MGMFDHVQHECVCPVCHSKVTGFQSKSGPCELTTLQPSEVDRFYSSCGKCGCWIEFEAIEVPKENFVMVASSLKGNKLPGRDVVARKEVYIRPQIAARAEQESSNEHD